MDIRKFGIAIAVAILTAILIYSIADAIAPPVDFTNCYDAVQKGPDPVKAKQTNCTDAVLDEAVQKACVDQKYSYEVIYGSNGCIEKYNCNQCYKQQQDAQERHSMIIFYTAIVLGLIAIVIGFLLPLGSIHEWVGLGFIIGGVLGLFIGTVQYWNELSRLIRPLVIFAELLVVLFIVYRKLAGGNNNESVEETKAALPVGASRTAKKKK